MSTDNTQDNKHAELRRAALEYHEFPTPGKVAIAATKQLTNQRDLALAYSPASRHLRRNRRRPQQRLQVQPRQRERSKRSNRDLGRRCCGLACLGLLVKLGIPRKTSG
jgi:malic enzyme